MSAFFSIKKISSKKPPTCSVVIVAAGLSQRCKGEDKLFHLINDKPVLAYTIEAFENSTLISEIIIVTREDKFEQIGALCKHGGYRKTTKIIAGGATRTDSVVSGVFAVSNKAKLIAIHDGARPCIDKKLIDKTITTAAKFHAAAPAVKVSPTVKRVQGGVIAETVDRETLYEIQTPQIFRAEIIKAALTNAVKKSIPLTDDCQAAEIIGATVHIVEGSHKNIKITNPEDLIFAQAVITSDR
ncbi:MAG: 2-C-methyl-D-erythritol 4-phosphate cytidylyltransferase [Oscillospiraceae bacterium]|nr:2-C-methyl-D-erythritol 4-phosphate cytidylyltransferase [Oscillospiraceae bacterium]MCL2278331.1 2-C-methyl-D-erythritol 4-phosphate cytidylyltransferase [Oscillospiraceae bacterium]